MAQKFRDFQSKIPPVSKLTWIQTDYRIGGPSLAANGSIDLGEDNLIPFSFAVRSFLSVEGIGIVGGRFSIDGYVIENNKDIVVIASGSSNASQIDRVSFYGWVDLIVGGGSHRKKIF